MKIDNINQRLQVNTGKKNKDVPEEKDTFSKGIKDDLNIYSPPQTKSLNIIYTNDIHGAILPAKFDKKLGTHTGGMACMGTVIKELKSETEGENLLLDGGDWALGSCESKITRGKTMIDVMNHLGYDGAEIGNHEFDWGQEPLGEMISRADFPVVGANIIKDDGSIIGGAKPYFIKEVNGIKIGVLGLISPETPETVDPKNIKGITFKNPKETAKEYLPEMKKDGAELIIVLSHEGIEAEEELAKDVQGIDVIVGGHSHTSIEQGKQVNNTIIVQAGSNGVKVGNLHLDIDRVSKKVLSFQNSLITVNNSQVKPDKDIEAIINPVIEETKRTMSSEVGKTEVELSHNRENIIESVMGNVLTDSMRASTGSDIAVENSGGIRSQIGKGDITLKDLYNVLPFDTYLVTIDMKGKDIKELLEISAGTKDNLHVSGLTMDIDLSKPQSSRVFGINIDGKPLEMEKNYRVTTEDFLAIGATEYTPAFSKGKNLVYGEMAVDALKSYVQKHSPMTSELAKIEGRINFINK